MKFCRAMIAVAVLGLFANVHADDPAKSTAVTKCDKCPAAKLTTAVATVAKCEGAKCEGAKCEGAKCEGAKCEGAKCEGAKCEGAKCEGAKCEGALACAKEKLPKLIYKVGKETTCCSQSAAALAEKSKQSIQYVLGEKAFTCKNEAFAALVSETEKFVDAYVSVSKCEASGQTTVAGKSYQCCVEAGKKAELVQAAVKEVRVSYKVGTEDACCAASAAALAKQHNKAIKYVVNGEATECELTSRLNLATAKFLAAVTAVADADKPVETTVAAPKKS